MVLRRLLITASVLALATALVAVPAVGASTGAPDAVASKKKGGKKGKCGKGKVQKTVTRNGKKVKKCVKKKPPTRCRTATSSGCVILPPLFEAPGKVLEGEAAKPFLQKYLVNSTFTDCPAGWPNCSVEQRYSHAADNSFYYCRLTSTSGADIRSVGEYGVDNVRVEPDGSWTFHEIVYAYGNYSEYEWQVSTTGVVTGAYRFQPNSAIEKLGPLQYVGGVAKDCSY